MKAKRVEAKQQPSDVATLKLRDLLPGCHLIGEIEMVVGEDDGINWYLIRHTGTRRYWCYRYSDWRETERVMEKLQRNWHEGSAHAVVRDLATNFVMSAIHTSIADNVKKRRVK